MDSTPAGRSLRTIWFALVMSVVAYGALAFILVPAPAEEPLEGALSNPVVVALHIAGAVAFGMAFVVSAVLGRRSTHLAMIIRWAMVEAAAIFGLMAAMVSSDARLVLPLGALAILGLLVSYPSDERLQGAPAGPTR